MKSALVLFTLGLLLATNAQAGIGFRGELTGHKVAKQEKKSKTEELRERLKGFSGSMRF